MEPPSENSLPSTRSERAARTACRTTVSTISSQSDPFASSELGDEIQLEEFSYIKAHIPTGVAHEPKNFVSPYPSRLPDCDNREVAARKLMRVSLDEENAPSEWETVAADEEFEVRPPVPPRPLRHRNNLELVFHAEEIVDQNINKGNDPTKMGKPIVPPTPRALPYPPPDRSPALAPRMQSFDSASSRYSDMDTDGVPERCLSATKEN